MTDSIAAAAATARHARRPSPEAMADALRRYPAIAEHERTALIRFAKEGAPEDIARAFHQTGLEPLLIRFKKEHPEAFPTGLRAWLPLLLFALVAAAVMLAVRAFEG